MKNNFFPLMMMVSIFTGCISSDGNEIENGIKTFLLKKGKSKYALTQSFPYKDDEKQAMILFILKRVK